MKYKYVSGIDKELLKAMVLKQTKKVYNDAFAFIKNAMRFTKQK